MGRYRLTPKRRQSIIKAQHVSAQRRRRGGLLAKLVINKTADLLTKGGAGKASDFFEGMEKKSKKNRKAQRKAARQRG